MSLEAPARKAILEDLYGTVTRYVRGPRNANQGKSLNDIAGRVKMARDSGATEEEIRDAIQRGISDPPFPLADHVEEVRRRFLAS